MSICIHVLIQLCIKVLQSVSLNDSFITEVFALVLLFSFQVKAVAVSHMAANA